MIQPVATVTTPANILFNRYLNRIDDASLGYTRHGFYQVDASINRTTILEVLKEQKYEISLEIVEGIKGLAGAVLAYQSLTPLVHSDTTAWLYSHFNANHHVIFYLSGSREYQKTIDEMWEALLREFPEAQDEDE